MGVQQSAAVSLISSGHPDCAKQSQLLVPCCVATRNWTGIRKDRPGVAVASNHERLGLKHQVQKTAILCMVVTCVGPHLGSNPDALRPLSRATAVCKVASCCLTSHICAFCATAPSIIGVNSCRHVSINQSITQLSSQDHQQIVPGSSGCTCHIATAAAMQPS